jgi:putative sterol carrier protein
MAAGVLFPSQAWFDQYREAITADERYSEVAASWGSGWNGDFQFTMTEIPFDRYDRDAFPPEVETLFESYVTNDESDGYTGSGYVALSEGSCSDARLLEDPSSVDPGFTLTGPYEAWVSLLEGEIGAIKGVLTGFFALEGSKIKLMRNTEAATQLTDVATTVEARYLHTVLETADTADS